MNGKRNVRFGIILIISLFFMFLINFIHPVLSQGRDELESLDRKVKEFLENHRDEWVDWNIPEADGKVLYDRGISEFLEHVRTLSNFETTINRASHAGISISYKKTAN